MGIVGFKQQRTRLQMSLIGMDTNGMRWGNRWLITGEVNSKYRSTKIERERERDTEIKKYREWKWWQGMETVKKKNIDKWGKRKMKLGEKKRKKNSSKMSGIQ